MPLARMSPSKLGQRPPLRTLYRQHFAEPKRERLFLSSLSFFAMFATIRAITHAIHSGEGGPFHFIIIRGVHVHHLVIGILLLLGVGYLWLTQVDVGESPLHRRLSRLTAVLYGIGAALTLDEFALWLDLEDVYWTPQGRLSIDVVILFGSMLSIGLWGGSFLRAVARRSIRAVHNRTPGQ